MLERRRFVAPVLLTLALTLLPGWALASGRRAPAPTEEGAFALLLDWIVRGWESLAHRSPASPGPLQTAVQRAGCGIDPNGTGCR
jgi:hypothetical protein